MRPSIRWILVLILFTGLTACNLNLQYRGSPQAWMDAPLEGFNFPLAPFEVVAHANDPSGIVKFESVFVFLSGWDNANDYFSSRNCTSRSASCLAEYSGQAQEGSTSCSQQPSDAPDLNGLALRRFTCNPDQSGYYLIRVRAMNSSGAWSDYAQAVITIGTNVIVNMTDTPEATATIMQTATPLPSPTVTLTPTPSVPTLILNINANCRLGPSQLYEVYTSILAGNQLPIEGTNDTGTWWLVRLPTGERCWISAVTGTPVGNINLVPVVETPPLKGCYVFDPNQQKVCTVPCPPNANPGGACTP